MRIFNPTDMIIDVHDWYRRASERRELLAMDDRMLRDIGITRVDAVRAATERRPRVVPMPWAIRRRKAPIPRALIEGYAARAHRLRNEAFRRAFAALFRWLRPQSQPMTRARKLAPVAR